jgi:hypothetical protein
VRILALPDLPPKGDVSDWLTRGGEPEELDRLAEMAPIYVPSIPMEGRLRLKLFEELGAQLSSSYLVKGVISAGGMSVVYGDSNVGKSFFVLDLALHLALGWNWRGKRVRQGGVIYIAGEGVHGISNRAAAFRLRHSIDGRTPFAVLPTTVDLRDPQVDLQDLVSLVSKAADNLGVPIKLIVVDTLSRALAGGNENAPEDMGAYVMNVDHLREVTGAHVMSVHHTGKDIARGARGHSLLRAATDTEVEIARQEGDAVSTARVTKQRDLPTDGVFAFTLLPVDLGDDDDGDPVSSCVVVPASVEGRDRRPSLTPGEERALALLRDAVIREGVGAPPTDHFPRGVSVVSVDVFREYLERGGVLDKDASGHRVQWKRVREALLAKGYAGSWEGWIWAI